MRQVQRAEAEFQQWPILEPLEGERERPIALNKPVCVAGDRVRVNLPLPDETVSRAHVLFVSDEDGVYLRDLASLNHVSVNDEPVKETVLDAGDTLRIGPYVFRCEGGFAHNGHAHPEIPAADLRLADGETRFHLTGRTTVIGSRKDCDIRVSDELVSPAHAVIFEREGRRFIRDLRSVSGTFVNDRMVGTVELTPGDFVRVGNTNFHYEAAPAHVDDTALGEVLAPAGEQGNSTELPPELQAHDSQFGIIPLVDDSESGMSSAPVADEQADDDENAPIPIRLNEEEEDLELAHAGASHPGQVMSGSMAGERRARPPHTEADSDDFDLPSIESEKPNPNPRREPSSRRSRSGQRGS